MKKLPVFLLISLMVLVSFGFILSSEDKKEEFKPEWKQVDKLVEKGLPKSALNIVDSIFLVAKETENTPQVLKSLIYRISLQSQYKEEHLVNAITVFEDELMNASVPEQQLLQSLLAELYLWYYQQNRWIINDRTALAEPEQEDISRWDAVRLNAKIRKYYLASLNEQEQLEEIPIKEFSAILNVSKKEKEAYALWPTLYDLLCNRAIDYFLTSDARLANMDSERLISNKYLVPAKDFLRIELEETDDLIELKLFQQLLTVHVKQKNTVALLDLDLRRLKYVYEHIPQNDKNRETYISLFESLSRKYRDYPVFVEISYELAKVYQQSGTMYNPQAGDKNRWDLNKADSICHVAVKAFPNAAKANACQNMINDINTVSFALRLNTVELPDKPFLTRLDFRNVTKLHFKIVKVDPEKFKEQTLKRTDKNQISNYLKKNAIHEWQLDLPDTKDHQNHATELIVPKLDKGFYLLFSSDTPDFDKAGNLNYNPVWVSRLSYITRSDRETESFELYVLDREKGTPVPEVTVTTYRTVYEPRGREYTIKKLNTYQTDESGYLKINAPTDDRNNSFTFSLTKDGDKLFSEGRQHIYYNRPDEQFHTKTYLFTDRAIYRPGQTVYFKGIVVDKKGNDVKIKPEFDVHLRLMNTNYKEISSLDRTTNKYGSFQGAFVIPQGGLNGRMTIKCSSGTVSFLVEEYKRPTFRVAFDTIAETYKLGDEIRVPGRSETYTGNAVSGASVKFRVVQQLMYMPYYRYYFYIPHYPDREIANGTVVTDENGNFTISFKTEQGQDNGSEFTPNYLFKVYVDVTDMTGEVQSSQTNVAVGRFSKLLTISANEKIQKEKIKGIKVNSKNLAGAAVETETAINVYRLIPPEHLLVKRNWNKPDIYLIPEEEYRKDFPYQVYQNEEEKSTWKREKVYADKLIISGEKTLLVEQLASMAPGEYFITVRDMSDTLIKAEQYVTLYSAVTKKLPVNLIFWSTITEHTMQPGDILQLVVGSADKKTKVLYELVNGNEVVERHWITVSHGQKIIDIPVKENYRGGFNINLRTVKHNRDFSSSYHIKVPFTNKKLEIALETYRDFLTPGQKEQWKVKISGPDGEKLAAELLAGMYDASLDKFQSNEWHLNLYQTKRSLSRWETGHFRAGGSHILNSNKPDQLEVKFNIYPSVNWFGYQQGYNISTYGNVTGISMRKQSMAQEADAVMIVDDDSAIENEIIPVTEQVVTPPTSGEEGLPGEQEEIQVPLRTNFNETAFFYPQLQTDSSGNVIFSFTTPDALTEWRLLLLAHTKDLKTGTLVENFKAKKDLMIIPNVPRFVRQGDQLVFSAKVINYSDQQLNTEVNLELFNPVTMNPADILDTESSRTTTVSIDAHQSALVQWKLNIPFDISMLGYRIKAISSTFSDGEERMIPVLTNRMLVTETLPMYLKGNATKKFRMDKLADSDKYMGKLTLQNYRFTVEFTSNPAWYAIQALPYLSEPKVESASNLFHMYYANALSSFIVNSNPKIKNVFESWKTYSPDAFLSNLQKNQELKKTVLNATPWVLEAENEAEQKRRIGILFDINRISNQTEITLQKLRESQMSNGAWPWFRGMREDRYSTQQIVLGFARLSAKQVINIKDNQATRQMLRKAISYLDKEIQSDYERLKKYYPDQLDKNHLGSLQIQYLYARTLIENDVQVKNEYTEAFDYYLGQAKKYWLKQNNYLQAMIALTLNRSRYRNEAEGIIRSLKERSIQNNELGMYWRQESGWYWYQAPVETQAMIIEAFSEVVDKPALVDQMKIWLLKQKQTTRWNTSSATAEAVYALLMNGERLLDNNKLVTVKVGTEEIHPQSENINVEAGTGYFKKAWTGKEIEAGMGRIEVTNPNTSVAWGAAYWQYFEQLDRITSATSPLSIEKKLFIETLTEDGPVLTELKKEQKLHTGDKVISRMIISTDRDMEYVQVNDMRSSAFEPAGSLSGYQYKGGLGYYENITDVSTDFYIRYLRKGTYVLEYPVVVTQSGTFSNGIATIQSYYAPEFAAHSAGVSISVE